MHHTKKIGIFVSHIFGEYQRSLCQGITERAREFGFLTEIFASTDGENLGHYSLGEKGILRIPNFSRLSGVIFASGTYLNQTLRRQIATALKQECSCPVLELTHTDAVFPTLMLDNDSCAASLTTHLIETHRCRRICYLGSESEPFFSGHRLALYREVLQKYGLPCQSSDVCSCRYEKASIAAGLDGFFRESPPPDAILCYNDRMAVIVMELLAQRGLRIPEDIRVTGFDDLAIGQNAFPALTTVTFPICEMGARAFDLIWEAVCSGRPLPASTIQKAAPVYRGSCCAASKKERCNPLPFENALLRDVSANEQAMLADIRLSAGLYDVTDLEEGMELLEEAVSRIRGCREFYLCLYPDWNHIPGHIRAITSAPDDAEDTDAMQMPFAFRSGRQVPGCSFTKKNILPDFLYTGADSSYIYTPLFFGEREFGYAAFSFENGSMDARFDLLLFLRNLNTLLKHLCDLRQTGLLVNRLETVSGRDELTRLPNRQGFRLAAHTLLGQALSAGQPVLSMQFFLSDSPGIAAAYGRSERDFAICLAGHALENAVGDTACISHQGGGEFLLLAPADKDSLADDIEHRIAGYLTNYSRLHPRPYAIGLTAIRHTQTVTANTTLEDLFP